MLRLAALLVLTLGSCAEEPSRAAARRPVPSPCGGCDEGERCCEGSTNGLAESTCVPVDAACPVACSVAGACDAGDLCVDRGDGGPGSCVTSCAPALRCGTDRCCAPGSACVNDACLPGDLAIDDTGLSASIAVSTESFGVGDCRVQSGCVGSAGARSLLTFTARVTNAGAAPIDLAGALGTHACGAALVAFIGWRLLDGGGAAVASGSIASECVADDAGGGTPVYTCGAPGLGAGWSSAQPQGSTCSAADVTGVAPGAYTLELTVDPAARLAESDRDNNTTAVPVTIPAVSCPTPLCGRHLLRRAV